MLRRSYTRFASILSTNGILLCVGMVQGAVPEIVDNPLPLAQSGEEFGFQLEPHDEDGDFVRVVPSLIPDWLELSRSLDNIEDHAAVIGGLSNVVDIVSDGEFMYALQPDSIQKFDGAGESVSTLSDFSDINWGEGYSIIGGADGFLYVSDVQFHQIVRVDKNTGVASVFAGSSGSIGFQDGDRLDALFFGPTGLALDVAGNLFIAEKFGNRIRKIDPTGVVTTLDETSLSQPTEIDLDADGGLWVANSLSNQVLKLSTSDGEVLMIVGSGQAGAQDGTPEQASFNGLLGLAVDASDFIWVSCEDGNVRKISPEGKVTTLEWEGEDFEDLRGIGKDPNGSVCLTDFGSNQLYGLMFEYKLIGYPLVEHSGDSIVSFLLYDGTGNIETYQTTISVNVPPVMTSADSATAREDKHFELVITATDANDDVPVISAVELPGWLSFHNENTLQGTPLEADIGEHVATMLLSDGRGGEQTVEINFEVLIGNEPPSFTSASSVNALEDEEFLFEITTTDPDEEDILTITAEGVPPWLTLTPTSNGKATLQGTPLQMNVGLYIFVVKVTDSKGVSDSQTLIINAINVNDAPVWDSETTHQLTEDAPFQLTLNAIDEDVGDVLVITPVTIPDWLSLEDNEDGSAILSGTPLNDQVGNTEVVIKATDLAGAEAMITLDLSVANTNDTPFFSSTSNHQLAEDSHFTFTVEAVDVDLEDELTITAINLPAWLSFTDNENGTGILSCLPLNEHVGEHSFQLKVEDAAEASVTVTQNVIVQNVNDAPFFTSEASHALTEDIQYSFTVEALDVDVDDELELTAINLPTWLTFVDHQDGTASLSGLPTNDHVGEHSFQVKVEDAAEASVTQEHTLVVENVNDLPEFTSQLVYQLTEDTQFEANITAIDVDAGDSIALSISELPAWLTFVDNGNGTASLSGLPLNEHVGELSLEVTVKDAQNAQVESMLSLTVANTNDAPFIVSDQSLVLTEDEEFVFTIRADDVDAGDTLTISTVSVPSWVSFFDVGDGTANLSGTPLNEHVGSHVWSFLLSDYAGAEVAFDIAIEVSNTNDPVVWLSEPPIGLFEERSHFRYDMEASDPDAGDELTISTLSLPDWLSFSDHGDGTATLEGITPVTSSRTFQFEVIVADQEGSQDIQTVQIEVPVNSADIPVIHMPGRVTLNFDSGFFDTVFTVSNNSDVVRFYQNLTFTLTDLPDQFSIPETTSTDEHGNLTITLPLLLPGETREVTVELSSGLREPGDVTATSHYQFEDASVPFADLTPLSSSFYESSWFGVIQTDSYPWVWHQSLGWLYIQSSKPDQVWAFHNDHGWLYFSASSFPYFLDMDPQGWLYFAPGESSGPFRVFDYRTMRYIEW